MCTARFRWAPASFCISAVLAAGVPALGEAPAASLAGLELAAARQGAIYLLIDPPREVLEIKVRGIVLDAVPLAGFALLGHRPAAAAAPAAVELPAAWTVEEEPEAAHRRLVAPERLVPYSEAAEEAPAPAGAAGDTPLALPPDAYRVRLDAGWALDVGAGAAASFSGRLGQALRHGWTRLWGRPVDAPALVAIAVAPEDGRRLHHLFRRGTRILIAGARPEAAPP